jgi:hypothetical protein
VSGCDDFRQALVETARGRGDDPAARRHAAQCGPCAGLLAEEARLTRALAELAAADESLQAPAALEARLRSGLRALRAESVPAARAPRRLVLTGLAAALIVAAALVALMRRPEARPPALERAARPDSEFAPLVFGEPLDGADALHLTRVRVPRGALASFGWPEPPGEDDGRPVEAEVLIGQDGLARGIRFVADDGGGGRRSE